LAAMSKVDRYRKEANRCAELAKDASPAFLAEIYQKVAMRYVFMAEDLLKGPNREGEAKEPRLLFVGTVLRTGGTALESPCRGSCAAPDSPRQRGPRSLASLPQCLAVARCPAEPMAQAVASRRAPCAGR
jgi:hypothetical protein